MQGICLWREAGRGIDASTAVLLCRGQCDVCGNRINVGGVDERVHETEVGLEHRRDESLRKEPLYRVPAE